MSEAGVLRAFVAEALTDAGAEVTEQGGVLWVRSPESVRQALEIPETLALVFEPDRLGEFGAELIAPGSFLLERILQLAMRRGRWDGGRAEPASDVWIAEALSAAGFPVPRDAALLETGDGVLVVFTFRVVLLSDEKRESFHAIVVPAGSDASWEIPAERAEAVLSPTSLAGLSPDLEAAHVTARRTLQEVTRPTVEAFRKGALVALEEEVRRIFGYFDGTVGEVRAAAPSGAEDVVRAIEAERDRRLTEALERFEPHASASLCGVRVVLAPTASVRVWRSGEGAREAEVVVDAFTRSVRGPACEGCGRTPGPRSCSPSGEILCADCAATAAASAPLRARPRSDTPRPRRRDASAAGRSPRGSMARSRSASLRRRGP